jgi:ketosteroid isomerase-like protein
MKMRPWLSVLLLVIVGAWIEVRAQGRASDEQTVRALDDQERIAALKRDVPALERLWSDQFAVNAPNNQVVVGKRAVLDTFVRAGIINFSSFEREIEFMRVDDDFATIMGLETVRPLTDAHTAGLQAGQTIRRRFTNIWRREADTWRLFIRHANVIPPR